MALAYTNRSVKPNDHLLDQKERDVLKYYQQIYYSDRYYDDEFEYRHVVLPKELLPYVPSGRLMSETEWRSLGVRQSPGWEHYMIHAPEPHVLLFKREKNYQEKYLNGNLPPQETAEEGLEDEDEELDELEQEDNEDDAHMQS